MRRAKRKPIGQYMIGSNVPLPSFRRSSEEDWTNWIVVWRYNAGPVKNTYKLTGLTRDQIKKKIKDAPTLWDVVKFITNSEWSQIIKESKLGFKSFLEAKDLNIRSLIQSHFSITNMADTLETSKLNSFLALPGLREYIPSDRIEALLTTLESLSSKKKKTLTYNWLADSLEN